MTTQKQMQVTDEAAEHRTSAHEIHPQFLNRWSPRAYSQKEVSDETLLGVFEAAKWAPSGNNEQPWRFIIARTKEDKEKFYPFINEFNRIWCERAPVLVVIASKKVRSSGSPNRSHSFDAGAAWGYLALEAANKGLISHAMGGFDPVKAREILQVPEEYELHCVVAIGYRGEKAILPEDLQEREVPSTRRPLSETIFEAKFEQALRTT